jgi:hypothetical protein
VDVTDFDPERTGSFRRRSEDKASMATTATDQFQQAFDVFFKKTDKKRRQCKVGKTDLFKEIHLAHEPNTQHPIELLKSAPQQRLTLQQKEGLL